MSAKLSPAVVSIGPTDELLANDGRGNTPQDTLNKQTPKSNKESAEIGDKERTSKIKIPFDKIEKSLLKKISAPKISDDAAQQGLEASIGRRLVSIYGNVKTDPKAAEAQQKAVTAYRDDKTGRDKLSLKDAAGNVYQVFDKTDPTKVTALATAFQALGTNASQAGVIDQKGKWAAALGLLDQAVALGVPKLIDDIATYVQNNKEAKRILIDSTLSVIQRSDLPTLNKILDLVGSNGVLQKVPNAISLILMFYRMPWGTKPEQHQTRRTELLNTLSRINVNWNVTTRNGATVTDLSVTNYASSAARKLLTLPQVGTTDTNLLAQPYVLEALMAGGYPSRNIQQLAKSMYPEIAAWGG